MKVRLNLATNGLQTHRKFLAGSALIGAIAGAVFVALVWHVYSVRRADEAVRAKTAQVRQEMAGLMSQRPKLERVFAGDPNAQLPNPSAFVDFLVDEKNLNWTPMVI